MLNRDIMGKKKGSGRMSEEERLLLDESKRHQEQEIQKQKEDMLTQFLKVRQEYSYSNLVFFYNCVKHL